MVDEYKGKDVVFISFSKDITEVAKGFIKKTGFKYNVITNYPNTTVTFCIIGGWPMNMVIDKKGILRFVQCGSNTDERAKTEVYDKMKPVIDKYLEDNK